MGLIYKPIGIVLGIVAALLGKRVFNFAWTKIDDQDPPKATTEETSWRRLLAASAVQGVIFKVGRGVVDRYGAIGWRYLTGVWPGEKRPGPDEGRSHARPAWRARSRERRGRAGGGGREGGGRVPRCVPVSSERRRARPAGRAGSAARACGPARRTRPRAGRRRGP